MIIDAHLHVWRPAPDFPDPSATTVSPLCDVPLELLTEYMNEHQVDRAVLVQPLYPGEDNSYVADCAAAEPDKFAAVCVVDPQESDAPNKLDYWVRERGCRGLRLRPRVPEESACFGETSTFPLWEKARKLEVVVSILANPEHLPLIGKMAQRFPEVRMVIDHLAHPDVAAGVSSPSFQNLLHLARCPNVYAKVSGFYYFSKHPYPYADCEPLFRAVYEHFGADRLIWGSDFPHVLLKSGYRRSLLWLDRAYPFLTSDEIKLIRGGNAKKLYWSDDV